MESAIVKFFEEKAALYEKDDSDYCPYCDEWVEIEGGMGAYRWASFCLKCGAEIPDS